MNNEYKSFGEFWPECARGVDPIQARGEDQARAWKPEDQPKPRDRNQTSREVSAVNTAAN